MLRGPGARRVRLALHRRAPQHAVPALGRQPACCRWSPTCSTTRRSPTWRRVTSSSTATLMLDLGLRSQPLRHRARDHREDPEAPDPHLRGADLVHGSRVRRGQEDHVARRLRGVVDAGQVPLCRLIRQPERPRWAAVVVNYEAGDRCSTRASARCSPTRAPARSSSSSSTTARATARSTRCCAAHPGRARRARARQRRLRARREPRHRRDAGADRRGAERRHGRRSRARRGRCSTGSTASRASARAVRGSATSTAPTTRRPARCRRSRSRSATGCSACGGRRTGSRRGTASSTPIPSVPRLVDWVSGAAIWLRRTALDEVGGWDERYFMYLEDTDLCWRLRRAGWDVAYEPSARRRPRAGREHRRAGRTGCCSSTTVRPGGSRRSGSPARGRCCSRSPRCTSRARAVLAMAEQAWRARGVAAARAWLACPACSVTSAP